MHEGEHAKPGESVISHFLLPAYPTVLQLVSFTI